ncbi:MAG TPA: BrnA antitoxin family protein [Pyrinomonadaceae bacterium]|nr:BrnA antitoxin family protein [Pyrinomonadaceae bacterium]
MSDDFDETILADEKAFKRRFKRIERPAFLDELKKKENKRTITIMLDPDIIEHFKAEAEQSRTGYQTLINQTLRESIEDATTTVPLEKLLKDKEALRRLKAGLEKV